MDLGPARLERVLARNRDAVLVERLPGRHTVIRRDQVLGDPREGPSLDEALTRWARGKDDADGVSRYHLRPEAGVDVGELVADLREARGGGHRSPSPNHLLRAEPAWWAGPFGVPEPAPALAAPPAPSPDRPPAVAVLDTGLCPHPWFDDRAWYAAQRGESITEVLDPDLDYELESAAGHGTFVAGVVLQHAPAARLLIRRVLGSDGLCDEFGLVRALRELLRHRGPDGGPVDVVNLSLGCYTFDDEPTPVVERAVEAFGGDTVVVAAAGNDASDRPLWPAALESVVAVAALDAAGEGRAAFSNHGTWVDACAVGEDVHSSFLTVDGPLPAGDGEARDDPAGHPSAPRVASEGEHRSVDPDHFRGYARWSGTSFAAPAVAGAIAARSHVLGTSPAEAAGALLDPARAHFLHDPGAVVGRER